MMDVPMPPGLSVLADIICGCATVENTWAPIVDELRRLSREEYAKDDGLAAALVEHAGWSEHGGSIRGGWLTKDGEAALEFFDKWGPYWLDAGVFVDEEGCCYGAF